MHWEFSFFRPLGRQMVLETLYALTSNTKLVKEAMAKGKSSVFLFYLFILNNLDTL